MPTYIQWNSKLMVYWFTASLLKSSSNQSIDLILSFYNHYFVADTPMLEERMLSLYITECWTVFLGFVLPLICVYILAYVPWGTKIYFSLQWGVKVWNYNKITRTKINWTCYPVQLDTKDFIYTVFWKSHTLPALELISIGL